MAETMKVGMKNGVTKDWGVCRGGINGYLIQEGTEVCCMTELMKYFPHIEFHILAVASGSQADEAVKASR